MFLLSAKLNVWCPFRYRCDSFPKRGSLYFCKIDIILVAKESFANMLMTDLIMMYGRSFMNSKKIVDPRTDPRGTPALIPRISGLTVHNNFQFSTSKEGFDDGMDSTRYTITGKLAKQSLMPYLFKSFRDV